VLVGWALSSGQSQVGLEWNSMLLRPCIISIPTTANLFMIHLGDDRVGWGKRLTSVHRLGHLNHWVILFWFHPLESIHIGCKYLQFVFNSDSIIHIPPPQISISSILKSHFFQVLNYPGKSGHPERYSHTSDHLSFQEK
jgi:hypothetical protein